MLLHTADQLQASGAVVVFLATGRGWKVFSEIFVRKPAKSPSRLYYLL